MISACLTFESALYDPSTISCKLRDGVEHAARAANGHDGTYDGHTPGYQYRATQKVGSNARSAGFKRAFSS